MYYDLFLVDFEINSTAEHKRLKKTVTVPELSNYTIYSYKRLKLFYRFGERYA